jgi:Tfp pilus assembly protein PilF
VPAARAPAPAPARESAPAAKPHARKLAAAHGAAESQAAKGDRALRAFDTKAAQSAFESALELDPMLPEAHRGMGMVYVLQGKNAAAKSEYAKYLKLDPDAPDRDQIERLLSR